MQKNWEAFFLRLALVVSLVPVVYGCVVGFLNHDLELGFVIAGGGFLGVWVLYWLGMVLFMIGQWIYQGLWEKNDEDNQT